MSKNRYEAALGVLRLRWQHGELPDSDVYVPVLVELWRPTVSLSWIPTRPEVAVTAVFEVRVRVGKEWKAVGSEGELRAISAGTVRRWARLSHQRAWKANIKVEGWQQ